MPTHLLAIAVVLSNIVLQPMAGAHAHAYLNQNGDPVPAHLHLTGDHHHNDAAPAGDVPSYSTNYDHDADAVYILTDATRPKTSVVAGSIHSTVYATAALIDAGDAASHTRCRRYLEAEAGRSPASCTLFISFRNLRI